MRLTAASRLARHPDDAGAAQLEAMTAASEPRNVRASALSMLAQFTDKTRAIAVATRSLGDGDQLFAASAVRQLARIGGETGRATLQQAQTRETRVTVREAIRQALRAH